MERSDSNMKNEIRVLAVPGDTGGCGHYRVIKPTMTLQSIGRDITLAPAGKFYFYGQERIFTQRIFSQSILELLKNLKDQTGCSIVCDCDDLIWTWNGEKLPDYNFCSKKIDCDANRAAMEKLLDQVVDRVTVSTRYLRIAMRDFTDESKITHIPNYLSWSDWHFDLNQRVPREPVFFFAGTSTHVGSKESGLYGDFSESLVDYLRDKKMMSKGFKPWFLNDCQVVPYSTINQYAQDFKLQASACTFVIAPLQDNLFNKCKSNLKYLETAAVGRVCLCQSFEDGPFESIAHPYQKIPVDADKQKIDYIVKRALSNYNEILIHQYKKLNEYWLENHISEWGKAILE